MKEYLDTSIEAFEKLGIKLTGEQYSKLCDISLLSMSEEWKKVPVFTILLVLKHLNLLPNEMVCDNEIEKTEKYSNEWFTKMYGTLRKEQKKE